MLSPLKISVVVSLVAAQGVLSLPEVFERATSCAPTISTVTIPHSCFQFTAETPQASNCPLLKCRPVPDCELLETTTIYVPPTDRCCPETTTTTIQGPCPTCQTGCGIGYKTVLVTTTPIATVSKRADVSTSKPCTTTIKLIEPFTEGPVKTVHTSTVIHTVLEDCGGCEFVDVRNLGGIGPVVVYTTTTVDPKPATTTVFACSKTPTY